MTSVIGRNNLLGRQSIWQPEAGFSMVELMITVVIVSVCLIMALRVFSISAAALSEAHNSMFALNVLQDKMDELQEKAILEDGVETSSFSEDIVVNNRNLSFTQEITQWKRLLLEEELEQEEEEEEIDYLCEAELEVSWGIRGKTRGLMVKTFLPSQGFRQEF